MSTIDLRGVVEEAERAVAAQRRGEGYARFAEGDGGGSDRDGGPDLYGTADAVGVLATLGRLDPDPAVRDGLAAAIVAFQQPDGRFVDDSHGVLHSTATAVGALHLLGRPAPPPAFLEPLFQPSAVEPFLDGLDWADPWLASHDAAGLLAVAVMTGLDRPGFVAAYLSWLDAHVDPATGLWPRGGIGRLEEWPGLFGNLGCSFHLHFLLRHLSRPIPHAPQVVDTCLELASGTRAVFDAGSWGYPQLDWAYSLSRASRQSGHRVAETQEALRALARALQHDLEHDGAPSVTGSHDLHTVGAVTALVAELSAALGDELRTGADLTPTTDLRPFI